MKEKTSIQVELDYLRWLTEKKKRIRIRLTKEKIRHFFLLGEKLDNTAFHYQKDYYL